MQSKNWLPTGSGFYLHSISLVICSVIITLIITIKFYVWNIEVKYDYKTAVNHFFIENHPFIMTAVLILIGFSLLVPRLSSNYGLKPVFIILIHGFMNGMALVLSLAPIFTLATGIWSSKIAQHFYSIHCWYGTAATLLMMIQFLSAFFYFIISLTLKQLGNKLESFIKFHKNIGHTVLGLMCISFVLGISEMNSIYVPKFPAEYNFHLLLPNMLALSAVFFCLLILYLVFSRIRLETAIETIKTQRLSEKKRFLTRVVEKQQKNQKKPS